MQKVVIDYSSYNAEDLLSDDYFVNTMINPTPESEKLWKSLLYKKELDEKEFLSAKKIFIKLQNSKPFVPNQRIKIIWKRIETTNRINKPKERRIYIFRYVAAASILMLLSLGYYFFDVYTTDQPLPKMVAIETETQQRLYIILPDSTGVWLNSDSRLEYPEKFSKDTRKVLLTGEAYFDVVSDLSKPFIVQTSQINVKVLGTTFNVTAYEQDYEVTTTLVEGKIELMLNNEHSQATTILYPKQQATINKESNSLSVKTVNPETYISWITGYYKFDNTSFEQIAKQFERQYGITIIFVDNELKSHTYSGTFLNNKPIEYYLNILCDIESFKYTINDSEIIINK